MGTAKQSTSTNGVTVSDATPYSPAEKAWLKVSYGNEYEFLLTYGLKIYDEEHREEGRRIARAMIEEEAADDSDEQCNERDEEQEEEEDDEKERRLFADFKADPDSHVADHHFSAAELHWIETNYYHSHHFLFMHGLEFDNDDECKEGVATVRGCMKDERRAARANRRSDRAATSASSPSASPPCAECRLYRARLAARG